MRQECVAVRVCCGGGAGAAGAKCWGGGTILPVIIPRELWGLGGTPQPCPQLEVSILPLQSFFEGWDASKKKDKTKGRQDHVSTCECL